ncbi:MAG: hypothetical protein ACOY3K_01885 [Candidatus Omnitrophota bacterium]
MKIMVVEAESREGAGQGEAFRKKMDEFLDVYSLYRKTRIAWIHDELKLKAYELSLIDPAFRFSNS